MNKRIALGLSLTLSLGIVAASTAAVLHARDVSATKLELSTPIEVSLTRADEPTPEMLATWKATARATDYVSPQVPI